MGKSKNIYIDDLKMTFKGETAIMQIPVKGDNYFSCDIECVDYDNELYRIVNVETNSYDLQELVERRYKDNTYEKATIDIRLRDMQYEIRKEFRKPEYRKSYTPEEVEEDKSEAWDDSPNPKSQWTPETPKPSMGIEDTIFNLAMAGIKSERSQEFIVNKMKEQLKEWNIAPGRKEIFISIDDEELKDAGIQHEKFEEILRIIKAKQNLALVGPAGSGKSTVIEKVAELLELEFYCKSVSAQTGVHEFFGYQDANGNYVRTLFREAYEKGGIFLLDEFDAGNPNVLSAMNQATANGVCAFADGMVKKHPEFICVMAGNTYGHGATSEYVGRNPVDGATLDRFIFMYFGYDEQFEMQLAPNKRWCEIVQGIRREVSEKKLRMIVSPRATFQGSALLNAGIPYRRVVEMTIYKGIEEDEKNLLEHAAMSYEHEFKTS